VTLKETVNSPRSTSESQKEAFKPDPHRGNLVANETGLIALEKNVEERQR